jgi:hypothetical protein
MPTKKIVYFFIALLLVSTLTYTASALPAITISLQGEGITINITYPEEAHPKESITHDVTITANTALMMNFVIVIYAPVNTGWQEVRRQTLTGYYLDANEDFTSKLGFLLPQEANGILYCSLNVSTSVNNNYLSATLYTTLVSEPTFSEMRVLYDDMLAQYTSLQNNYTTKVNEYNELFVNYSSLYVNYTTLLNEYNQTVAEYSALGDYYDDLSANYSSLNAAYISVLSQRNQLVADYNNKISEYNTLDENYRSQTNELTNLQTNFYNLNLTHYDLQTVYETLRTDYITLNQTNNNLETQLADLQGQFTDSQGAVGVGNIVMFIFVIAVAILIAFIIYIRRKQEEPYLVIRKETVNMKSDEET